jgi:hypothetical protein
MPPAAAEYTEWPGIQGEDRVEARVGSHGAPIRVYGPSRLRRSARLLAPPRGRYLFWTTTLSAGAGAALLAQHQLLPGLALVGSAGVAVAPVVLARVARPRVVLADRAHLSEWHNIEKWCAVIERAWPTIRGMTGIKDARPVIQDARWDLACLIAERGRLSGARSQATFAGYGLAPDDPLWDDLASRREQLDVRMKDTTGFSGRLQDHTKP